MMAQLRTLALSFLVLLYSLLFSGWVSALGLGELQLNSSLNEPFNAKVALLNAGELGADHIYVKLASKEDFKQVGAERELFLLDLRFSLDTSNPGKPFVRVTSTKPIREPYLDFLIQLEWPSGRLLKEYTVFLDLPVFAGKQSAGKQPARRATASTSTDTAQKKKATSASAQPQISTRRTYDNVADTQPGSHRVRGGETLWRIASNNRPQGSSVQQTMQAIHQRNSDAFVNGDMNLLKKGALLDLPDASEIRAVDAQLANTQAALSAEALHSPSATPELKSNQPVEPASIENSTESDGVLRLSAAGEGQGQGAGGAAQSTSENATRESLENDLAIAQEGLSQSERENLELQEKVERLEAQVETMSRLVELGDDQLSAIQQGVGKEDSAEPEQGLETTADISEIEEGVAEADEEQISEASDESEVSGDLDGVVAETPADVPGDDVSGDIDAPSKGFFGVIKDKLGFIAAGLLLVILGVLFLLSRNRKDEDDGSGMAVDRSAAFEDGEPAAGGVAAESAVDALDLESQKDRESRALETLDEEAIAAGDHGEVDPIGEADIYLSFGDYDQAEVIIRRALETQPDDSRLHLKLLELFSDQDDLASFDQHYPGLLALGDSSAIQSADRMRDAIPGAHYEMPEEFEDSAQPIETLDEEPPVSDALSAVVLDESLDLDDQDVSLELDLPEEASTDTGPVVEGAAESALEQDYEELDLGDIELELDEVAAIEDDGGSAGTISEFDDFDVDADLDLLIEGDEITTQLELAQAYLDMGDSDGAKDILEDVLANGNSDQQAQAREILKQTS